MNNPRAIQRHLVKALAAGALLAAAALPMAIATAAGADTVLGITFSTQVVSGGVTYVGQGDAGTFVLSGSGFAEDGGNVTVTATADNGSTAAGVTFSNVVDNHSGVTGDFAVAAGAPLGTYTLSITDNAGTGALDPAFTVTPAPSVTSLSVASGADTPSPFTVVDTTVSGSGFIGSPTVTFTSTVDGTSMTDVTDTATSGTETSGASSLAIAVTLENTLTSQAATPGTYTMTVTNDDGGTFTTGPIFTVIGNEITTVSPSGLSAVGTTEAITINGGGFQSGATVLLTGCSEASLVTGSATTTSASTITAEVDVTSVATAQQCTIEVENDGPGDNGSAYTAPAALGIDGPSALPPVITASSLSSASALVAGAPSTTVTFTGEGFSTYTTTDPTTFGAANTQDPDAVVGTAGTGCIANSTGTSLTCPVTVSGGTYAGPHTAVLDNDGTEGTFANAFTVDGPAITSASPAALADGAPIGTVVALTGTGFNATTTGTVAGPAGLAGILQYSSATAENLVVTGSPTATGTATVSYHTTDAYGAIENGEPFYLTIDAAPSVTSITYATGTTGVGVGATGQTITINGADFESGATVTAFTNGSGTADSAVTAKVTAVNATGTQITATVAIAAGDTNTIDGYKVTNPDGGVATALAVAPAGLVIDAAPTVTAVSPSTATPSATNAFTITGTGFATGATVTASSDGTCGAATVASATSITVSCTLGAEGSSAVTLTVTNLDGGSATSAAVLPAATTPSAPSFHVSAVHGAAVHGKTVTLTISGTGFYGQPKITSTAKGVKAVVTKDNGKVLTVRVSTPANVRGWHTFTVRNPNGKSGKVNYQTK